MEKYPTTSSNVDQNSLDGLFGRKMFEDLEGKVSASTSQKQEEEGFSCRQKKSLEDDPETELPEGRKPRASLLGAKQVRNNLTSTNLFAVQDKLTLRNRPDGNERQDGLANPDRISRTWDTRTNWE